MPATEKRGWALVLAANYRKAFKRLPPKYQNQVARKVQDLAIDPHEGGSKLAVKSLNGVFRLRAGDFRVFYQFNDSVVHLLYLSRRDDDTYDDLDHLELEALESFHLSIPRTVQHSIPDWERLAKSWAAPVLAEREPLPAQIDDAMLDGLKVPSPYRDRLRAMRFVDELLACEVIPSDLRMSVVEALLPVVVEPHDPDTARAVVVQADLIAEDRVSVSGPMFAEHLPIAPVLDGPTQLPLPLAIRVARRSDTNGSPYQGNASWGKGHEAKYVAKLDGTVQLVYSSNASERTLLTIDGHGELVDMVNQAKRAGGASQNGGSFLINEHRQVLVPTMSSGVLLAGVYTRDLEFTLDGVIVSPVAPAGIRPGAVWPGPHVGIRYTVTAGAADIRYERKNPNGNVTRVLLSDVHPQESLIALLGMCQKVKPKGGALYVNEARELFAPAVVGDRYEHMYVGSLAGHPWFPLMA